MAAEGSEVALKYTALVVEDMPIIRAVEQVFLSARGFKTEEVENGKEAVDLFTAGKSFDVVLMDMEMPVMNGIQVYIYTYVLNIYQASNLRVSNSSQYTTILKIFQVTTTIIFDICSTLVNLKDLDVNSLTSYSFDVPN